MQVIFALLILFQIKHLLADYPLQTPYMLGKFLDKGWVKPLASHCAVHALMTTIIVYFFTFSLFWTIMLACFDFVAHFIMDRLKAGSKYLGRYKALSGNEFKRLMMDKQEINKLIGMFDGGGIPGYDKVAKPEIDFIDRKFKHNQYFWYALGLDQFVHHITHYVIIYFIVGGI